MATEKELVVREIFKRRMAEQAAAKKPGRQSVYCDGTTGYNPGLLKHGNQAPKPTQQGQNA